MGGRGKRTHQADPVPTQIGKISAQKSEMGEWEIDPAELHRVYPSVTSGVTRANTPEDEETAVKLLLLRQELAAKDERLDSFQQKRDRDGHS